MIAIWDWRLVAVIAYKLLHFEYACILRSSGALDFAREWVGSLSFDPSHERAIVNAAIVAYIGLINLDFRDAFYLFLGRRGNLI